MGFNFEEFLDDAGKKVQSALSSEVEKRLSEISGPKVNDSVKSVSTIELEEKEKGKKLLVYGGIAAALVILLALIFKKGK